MSNVGDRYLGVRPPTVRCLALANRLATKLIHRRLMIVRISLWVSFVRKQPSQ